MKRIGSLAVAVVLAGVALAAQSQTMYRCGNTYQDKPCDDGQKGRIVGTTSAPKAADTARVCENNKCRDVPVTRTAPAPESADVAAERQKLDAVSKNLHLQRTARECVSLRKTLAGGTRKAQEAALAEWREKRCAQRTDFDAEDQCAGASDRAEMAQACGEYAKAGR
jgi:hypothetical protein